MSYKMANTFCTKITPRLKHISDKLAKFEGTNAIVAEYIRSERYQNVLEGFTRILVTVLFSTCVVKKWPFSTRCEQHEKLENGVPFGHLRIFTS